MNSRYAAARTREDIPWTRSRKLRILYIITQAVRGGAQTHLLNLATTMSESCEVHLVCGQEGFLTEACRQHGIEVHVVRQMRRSGSIFGDWRTFWQTRTLMREVQPDLVHVHTFKAGFIGRLAAWSLGIPAIYTLHAWLWGSGAVSRMESLIAIRLERIASRWCDKIITVSAAGEELVKKYGIVRAEKNITVQNGIVERLPAPREPRSTPVITMVARFVVGKDYEQLIRAYANLAGKARMWLVGDGEMRPQMERLVRSMGLQDFVEFLGERDDVSEILEKTDIFVLASQTEMLPISILEAMRAGVAVIASDVGGVSEAVENGVTGLLVPKDDPDSLSEALSFLLDEPEQRERMGYAGRKRFEAHFEFNSMQKKTYLLYLEVLRARGATANLEAGAQGRLAEVSKQLF